MPEPITDDEILNVLHGPNRLDEKTTRDILANLHERIRFLESDSLDRPGVTTWPL